MQEAKHNRAIQIARFAIARFAAPGNLAIES